MNCYQPSNFPARSSDITPLDFFVGYYQRLGVLVKISKRTRTKTKSSANSRQFRQSSKDMVILHQVNRVHGHGNQKQSCLFLLKSESPDNINFALLIKNN